MIFLFRTVQNMGLTLSNSSVNSVVRLLNGSVGAILTSVSLAIRNNVWEIMCQNIQRSNSQSVKVQANVQLEAIMV